MPLPAVVTIPRHPAEPTIAERLDQFCHDLHGKTVGVERNGVRVSVVVTGHKLYAAGTIPGVSAPSAAIEGRYQDRFGYWHAGFVFGTAHLRGFAVGAPHEEAEPEPFMVSVRVDRLERTRVTIPNACADKLIAWRDANWHEIVGCADGYTTEVFRSDGPTTWEHRALAYLHSVISTQLVTKHPFIEGENGQIVSTFGIRSGEPNQFTISG